MRSALWFAIGVCFTAALFVAPSIVTTSVNAQGGSNLSRSWGSVKAAYQGSTGGVIILEAQDGTIRLIQTDYRGPAIVTIRRE